MFALSAPFIVGAMLILGCEDDDGTPGRINPGGIDAAADRRGTGNTSGGPISDDDDSADDDDDDDDKDAGKKADADAGRKSKPLQRDAAGPGAEGDECSFNWDCQLELRCECDGECACKSGTRGTGKPGSVCKDANACASALCVEGPSSKFLCSDECKTDNNCPDLLPLCKDISFVGQICARVPPL